MNAPAQNFGVPAVIEEPDFLVLLFQRYAQHTELLSFSERTIRGQRSLLRLLAAFLMEKKIGEIQAVTVAALSDFQRWLFYRPTWKGNVRSAASMNRTLSVVKSFFHFLKQEGYLIRNPSEGLEFAREPQRLPRNILTPAEARRIIEAPDTATHLGYRDRAILEVLYATGIRKAELMNLTLEDVNLEEELLRINGGKGAKDRVVPLSQIACRFLESYTKGVRPEILRSGKTDRLFVSLRGRAISRNALGDLVEKYAKRARVKKHVTCHLWRHSCATHLLKNKANLRHVQEILGHRSLATTERYLSLTITDLKEAHRRCHPREKGTCSR
jgi:integrase/recombinase XerD